jgi:hypothetical protein
MLALRKHIQMDTPLYSHLFVTPLTPCLPAYQDPDSLWIEGSTESSLQHFISTLLSISANVIPIGSWETLIFLWLPPVPHCPLLQASIQFPELVLPCCLPHLILSFFFPSLCLYLPGPSIFLYPVIILFAPLSQIDASTLQSSFFLVFSSRTAT